MSIPDYLERYGWEAFQTDECQWQTTFKGELALYPLYVHQADGFVFLSIVPFVLAPSAEARGRFLWALLRWNRLLNWVKFALEPDDSVALGLEIPTHNLTYERFAEALDLLRRVADGTYLELLNLSRNPDHPARFAMGDVSRHKA